MTFQKGHKLATGRPKGSKNVLPIIREKVLNKLHKRINELDGVKVEELLDFAKSVMPKDLSIRIAPDVQYLSNTPRPEVEVIPEPVEVKLIEAKAECVNTILDAGLGTDDTNE